ncbi:rhamnan synthesis F family protein [Acetobacter sp.]|uniref:rhamnan synthesis F family protein n=1 Tax=Acetobacter sp. TaxID=440 RepID=UPI0025C717D4|nr:rhamnan synthesis F family protein [Acetobacter sp.]MCH4092205.1 rhamnan synthesis F family protein [Acetobacter sp.]MCI1299878.1 rhamnan synthesis F family protein [Acetobacter sp.]MCI1315896.1 rhamnan synthesis F family protein [Acetobacter sp.]
MPDAICLFASYAPTGDIPAHTAYYLSELTRCGFTIHLALSGCENIPDDTLDFCQRTGITPWSRPNSGHDFGAWKDLILRGCAGQASRILLANDSVFGPFSPLPTLFARMEQKEADVWGIAESLDVLPHLQSWFICFEQHSFHAPAIQRVFLQDFTQMTREELIWHGELGLAVACRTEKLQTAAAWSDGQGILSRSIKKTNIMHSHWRRLLRTEAIPFIKTELLRDNPFRLMSVRHWKDALAEQSTFQTQWIEDYLKQNPPRPNRPQINLKGRLLYNLVEQITGRAP